MTHPDQDRERDEPVTVTDKRRIDPQTGEVRDPGPAPSGPAPGAFAGETPEEADKAAELLGDLQRVQADFANYRKRALRDQELIGERTKAVVIGQLLPVLDDLDRAPPDAIEGVVRLASGVEALYSRTVVIATASPEGWVHHEGDGSSPVLGHVMRQGYRIGDQVLRHALVGVVDTIVSDDAAESDQ